MGTSPRPPKKSRTVSAHNSHYTKRTTVKNLKRVPLIIMACSLLLMRTAWPRSAAPSPIQGSWTPSQ
jgi:hypothetical protein